MKLKNKIKFFLKKFYFIKVYNSPFKPLKLKWYFGKIAIGTPYFLPRRAVKNLDKPGYSKFIKKRIGFDFVSLGYKTKWSDTDYRFEWSPIWSFVLFKWQIAITFVAPEMDNYWECWLYYINHTDKSKSSDNRIEQARKEFPCIFTTYKNGQEKETICYWDIILKDNIQIRRQKKLKKLGI